MSAQRDSDAIRCALLNACAQAGTLAYDCRNRRGALEIERVEEIAGRVLALAAEHRMAELHGGDDE